ncbi:MAG: hypothetical protein AB1349_02495 [Elusimicrobiota bacterium]
MDKTLHPKIGIVLKLVVAQLAFFFVLVVILGTIMYFYQKDVLMEQFFANAKTIVQSYAYACGDAKEAKDDLQLLAYIDRIKKLPDVIQSAILDPEMKVQIHTEKAEIGKIMQGDPISVKIVTSNDFLVQTYPGVGGEIYVFSMPIFVNMKKVAFLRIDFASQTIGHIMDAYSERAVLVIILMLALVAVGVYAVSFNVGKGITGLTALSEAIATEKFDETVLKNTGKRKDEIGALANTLARMMETVRTNYATYKEKLSYTQLRFYHFLQSIGRYFTKGVIFLDQDNKIIYINTPACAILSTTADDNIGRHILEINKNAELMEMLSASLTKPNQIMKTELVSLKTSAAVTTVQEETTNEVIGIIIVFY